MGKDLKGKELGEGLSQRKDGVYCGRFTNRFGDRKSFYDIKLPTVKTELNKAKYEDSQKINVKESKITLNDWYYTWLNVHKEGLLKANTRRLYNQVYEQHISPALGKYKLQDFSTTQIKNFLIYLKKNKNLDYESQKRAKIMLQDMFDKSINDELLHKNPAKGIKIIREVKEVNGEESGEVRVLSIEEQQEFFDCSKGSFYNNLFTVMLCTGLRMGECCALTWKDIDLDKMEINVSKTLIYQKWEEHGDTKKTFHIDTPKTKSSNRIIPINRQCELALKKQWLQKQVISKKRPKNTTNDFMDLLFTTKFNTPINAQILNDAIKAIIEEINLTKDFLEEIEVFSSHCFRHTFATRCYEADIPLFTIQKFLGHATLEMTTKLYASVLKEKKEKDMKLLENILDSTLTVSDERIEELYTKSGDGADINMENIISFNGVKLA